jgi:hypothetical protein
VDFGNGFVDFGKLSEFPGNNMARFPANFTKIRKIQTQGLSSDISPFFLTNLISLTCVYVDSAEFLENLRTLHVKIFSEPILCLTNLEKLLCSKSPEMNIFTSLKNLRTLQSENPSIILKSPRGKNIWNPEDVHELGFTSVTLDKELPKYQKNLERLEFFGNSFSKIYLSQTALLNPEGSLAKNFPRLTLLESLNGKIHGNDDFILYVQ